MILNININFNVDTNIIDNKSTDNKKKPWNYLVYMHSYYLNKEQREEIIELFGSITTLS